MGKELDAQVAEVMDLGASTQCPCDPEDDIEDVDGWQWRCVLCGTTGYINRRGFRTDISHDLPTLEYSTDIAASRTMEDWIEVHGSRVRYAQAMMSVLLLTDCVPDLDEILWWQLLYATPEQRCRGFLKAMGK